jgi:Flp pilus assembly protein TadG
MTRPHAAISLRARLARLQRSEDGAVTLEFVFVVTALLMVFMAAIETGVMMTRNIVLEQSVDVVMRNLRLGQYPAPTSDFIKAEICGRSTLITDCAEHIAIEMVPVDANTWIFPAENTPCIDRSQPVQPSITFNPGETNQIMLMRVCLIQEAMFPTTEFGELLPLDGQGGYGLIASTAFVNEP